jgi:hypothetical protein
VWLWDHSNSVSKLHEEELGDTSLAAESSSGGGQKKQGFVDRSLLRLDVGRPDHLGPLLGFVGDERAELGGRAHQRRAAEFGEPRLDLGIGWPALISWLSRPMISVGVSLGAPIATNALASKPGRNAPSVGMFGS